MIGSVFSRDGIAVGRVGTALLGLVQKDEPPVGKLRLVAPAKEGRPWVAECSIKAPIDFQSAKKLEAVRFPVLDASDRREVNASMRLEESHIRERTHEEFRDQSLER
jgi:DNA topoisomerase-1